jgi:hypothetical protein
MKRKYWILTLLPIFAVSIINVYLAKPNVGNSSFSLVDIEAHAGESDGESSADRKKGICKQNIVHGGGGTINIDGVDVSYEKKDLYSCSTDGSSSKCKNGGIYWDSNGKEVRNSLTNVASCSGGQ